MKHTTLAAACLLATASIAQAQISDGVVKLGVLTDMSGAYADPAGQGTVVATRMAIEDFIAAEKPAFKVEMVSADHQNKPDIASAKAREWIERQNVDVLTELVTTSVALNVMKLAKEKNRIALISGAASTRVTVAMSARSRSSTTRGSEAIAWARARSAVERPEPGGPATRTLV